MHILSNSSHEKDPHFFSIVGCMISKINLLNCLAELVPEDKADSICAIVGSIHALMHLLDRRVHPNDRNPQVQGAGWRPVHLLAHVDLVMRPENRVWRPVDQADIFALKVAYLGHGQADVVEVPAAMLDGVIEQRAEDAGDELGVGRELAELPRLSIVRRHVDAALLSIEALLSE